MRRLTYVIIGLIFLSLSCASIPVKSISQSDLEDLKGKWKGTRYGIGYTAPTELEILNTTIPISASITFHETRTGTYTYTLTGELQDGKLFFFTWNRNEYWVKLTLRKGNDKIKLEGDYQWGNYGRGTLILSKS
jgi:hypothetical protein